MKTAKSWKCSRASSTLLMLTTSAWLLKSRAARRLKLRPQLTLKQKKAIDLLSRPFLMSTAKYNRLMGEPSNSLTRWSNSPQITMTGSSTRNSSKLKRLLLACKIHDPSSEMSKNRVKCGKVIGKSTLMAWPKKWTKNGAKWVTTNHWAKAMLKRRKRRSRMTFSWASLEMKSLCNQSFRMKRTSKDAERL